MGVEILGQQADPDRHEESRADVIHGILTRQNLDRP